MKNTSCLLPLLAIMFFTMSTPSPGQTPDPNYDSSKTITLKGTVAGFAWANPRTFIVVDLEGKGERWAVEGASAGTLTQRGWSRTSLTPGDQVTVTALPLKQSDKVPEYLATGPTPVQDLAKQGHIVYGIEVVLTDGRKLVFAEKK
jgi:Family of unknown function (DUF6152)